MKLIKSGNRYILQCAFTEKDIAKTAGMRWHPADRVWATTDSTIAEKLIQYANDDIKAAIAAAKEVVEHKIEESRAIDSDAIIPTPSGLEYMPFQRAGIAFALKILGESICQ